MSDWEEYKAYVRVTNPEMPTDVDEAEGKVVGVCYIIAKKYMGHGCLAFKTVYGRETARLVDYLGQKKKDAGVEILTVSSKEAYGEYEPYMEASSKEDFVSKVLAMI